MKLLELLTLHFDLHDRSKTEVVLGDAVIPITHEDTRTKLLSRANYEKVTLLTQNLRKTSSPWTDWVQQHRDGKITWVSNKDWKYMGRIESSAEDGGIHVVVRSFDPEKVILDEVIADVSVLAQMNLDGNPSTSPAAAAAASAGE